jgi:hypothetical protein
MVQENKKLEADYRKIVMDSSSSLKILSEDKRKYYKIFIAKEKEDDEEDSKAILVGKLVDLLLLEPDLFDSKFYLSAIAKTPTGKMLDFVNALVKLTLISVNENGEVTRTFEDIATEARTIAEFDWSLKVILDKFFGKDPEIFYGEILKVKANKLTVVGIQDITNAEKIVEELKNNFVTSFIVNLVNSDRYIVVNQLQIEGYNVDNHLFKSMIDKVIGDRESKTLQAFDLKCSFSVEGFYYNYYLKRKSYIQAFLYYKALESLTKDVKSEFYGYTTLPTAFIVCDSINYYNPLIYELSFDDLQDAYLGFTHNGKEYPGVKNLIQELEWSVEMNIWNMSAKNYASNGRVNIRN